MQLKCISSVNNIEITIILETELREAESDVRSFMHIGLFRAN